MREVLWYQDAVDDFAQLFSQNSKQAQRVLAAVRSFAREERGDLKKLTGSEQWRLRVGDWRVMMVLAGSLAYVTEIHNRRDAY